MNHANRNVNEKLRHRGKSLNGWDVAITDAEKMIEQSKRRIAGLKRAIDAFKELRHQGHPFPGGSEAVESKDA